MIEVVVPVRLARALRRLNPGLSDDNVQRAIRTLTSIAAASLLEANEKLYTMLTHGIALEQDQGDGKKEPHGPLHRLRGAREQRAARHAAVQGQGRQEAHHPRRRALRERDPARGHRVQEPDARREVARRGRRPVAATRRSTARLPGRGRAAALRDGAARRRDLWAVGGLRHRRHAAALLRGVEDALAARARGELERGSAGSPRRRTCSSTGCSTPRTCSTSCGTSSSSSATSSGRIIRKVCRYQQFAAVNKAIARSRKAKKATDRGGVVWHTQGSGKSLTMLWLALKLRGATRRSRTPRSSSSPTGSDLDDQISRPSSAAASRTPSRRRACGTCASCSGPAGKTITDDRAEVPGADRVLAAGSGEAPPPRGAPGAHRGEEHLRARRRGAPHPVRRPRRQPSQGAAERLLLRLHGHADRQEGPSTLRPSGRTSTRTPSSRRSPTARRCPSSTRAASPSCGSSATRSTSSSTASSPTARTKSAWPSNRSTPPRPPSRRRAEAHRGHRASTSSSTTRKFIQPNGFKAQVVCVSREAAVLYKETLDRLNGPSPP